MAEAAEDLTTHNQTDDAADGQVTQNNEEPAKWYPDDWRDKLASNDEKLVKRLGRFKDPNALLNSYLEVDKKISSGEFRRTFLPEGATDAEIAEYRKSNGIPESPDKYDLKFEKASPSDEDKPFVDAFLKHAHETNVPSSQVNNVLNWFYTNREEQIQALVEKDQEYAQQAEDELRAKWGNDYRVNMNIAKNMLEGAPEAIREKLLGGRMADGTEIKHNPEFLDWLAGVAREINPAATVVPNAGTNQIQSIDDEISAIEKEMSSADPDIRKAYFKDEKKQARYRELLDAKDKLKQRG